ncbi:MAG: hypothetical protein ACTSR3_17850, partial [Candidatus Helarchaeota archaeon]
NNANEEINNFIKETAANFPNFRDTINISVHKWQTFLDSLPTVFNQVTDQTLENFTINLTKILSKPENGGRVKFEDLSRILGLNINQIRALLEKLISVSNLEAKFEDKRVIPLTEENKMQLEFEERIEQFQNEMTLNFDKISNFFITSYERKQLDNNELEIRERIAEFKNLITTNDNELKNKFDKQIKNPFNDQIMFNWKELLGDLNTKVDNIIKTLDTRNEYKNSFLEKIQNFKNKLEDISDSILSKIQDKNELPKLIDKLSSRVDELRLEITEQRNIFKTNINERSKIVDNFDKIIEDAHQSFITETDKIFSDLKNLKRKLEDKIFEKQQEAEKEKLKDKIKNHEQEFRELVDVMDKEVYNIIETGNLSEAATTLKQSYENLKTYIKTADNSISEFIKMNSRIHRNFKNSCVLILRDWKTKDLEALLNKAYTVLQDRVIIRNIEYAERAFHGNRVKVDALASKINMKPKIFKERLFDILGTSEELKGKLDLRTNEYVFRPDEEPKNIPTTVLPVPVEKENSFFDVIGQLAPFFTIFAGIATVTWYVWNFTNEFLYTILVPIIGLPLAFIIMGIYYKKIKNV